jgi:hypothetical protein
MRLHSWVWLTAIVVDRKCNAQLSRNFPFLNTCPFRIKYGNVYLFLKWADVLLPRYYIKTENTALFSEFSELLIATHNGCKCAICEACQCGPLWRSIWLKWVNAKVMWRYWLSISNETGRSPSWCRWAELISQLKSSHFQNSSILFARFLVCSTSDQVTTDAFGNHLG